MLWPPLISPPALPSLLEPLLVPTPTTCLRSASQVLYPGQFIAGAHVHTHMTPAQ
jgi:hypothetical protein